MSVVLQPCSRKGSVSGGSKAAGTLSRCGGGGGLGAFAKVYSAGVNVSVGEARSWMEAGRCRGGRLERAYFLVQRSPWIRVDDRVGWCGAGSGTLKSPTWKMEVMTGRNRHTFGVVADESVDAV